MTFEKSKIFKKALNKERKDWESLLLYIKEPQKTRPPKKNTGYSYYFWLSNVTRCYR